MDPTVNTLSNGRFVWRRVVTPIVDFAAHCENGGVKVRCLLSIVVQNQWNIEQLDINNAFLCDDLNEEANRQWFEKLTNFLIKLGFKQSYVDTSLFTINHNRSLTALLVYVDDISLILNVKHAATPMDPIVKLNETDGYLLFDPSTYRTLVGKLLYLTITRPDLSFAAQALSQYSHSTRSSHFEAFIRVLRYVKLVSLWMIN
ncbi:retrovirus-related pol polyprotein from transposon TNT 1-94 [Tanacetum coccineum]